MKWTTLVALLALTGAWVGCGDDDGRTGVDGGGGVDAGGEDAGPQVELCTSGSCATAFMVASAVTIEEPVTDEEAPDALAVSKGFDLDGRVSDEDDELGCLHQDFVAPDGTMGIDNQLGALTGGALATFDVNGRLTESLQGGSFVLLFQLSDVDDFVNDPRVTLTLTRGALPEGVEMPMLDDKMEFSPDQTFDVDPSIMVSAEGSIVDGVLDVGPLDIGISVPVDDNVLNLTVRNSRVRADVTETSLTNGVVAGELTVEEFAGAIPTLLPDTDLTGILEAQADLGPNSEAPPVCQALSAVLGVKAVVATEGMTL